MRFKNKVIGLLFLLLASPCAAGPTANCLSDDPLFNQAVAQGDYLMAFDQVAKELKFSREEKSRFKIVPGLQETNDSRNAEADPEKDVVNLDPRLFLEGENGVCQAVVHEREHLRQFQRDRRRLGAFWAANAGRFQASGWSGCEVSGTAKEAGPLAQTAFECLEDNKLATHAAVFEINGVLQQVPYTVGSGLRDDDRDYLLQQLQLFAQNVSYMNNPANESYYLPDIKREDRRTFCRGVQFAREQGWNTGPFYNSYFELCGGRTLPPRRLP